MAERSGSVVLDANLVILLVVGSADPRLIPSHKRLRGYSESDLRKLIRLVGEFETIVTLPNIVTEVANVADWGVRGPARRRIKEAIADYVEGASERYVPSLDGVRRAEFQQLDLTDTLLIDLLEAGTGTDPATLITIDVRLHAHALASGLSVIDFTQLR